MWDSDTKEPRESTGPFSASTSVGEILKRTGDAYPAISQSPIGESLMQVTLSPQEAGSGGFALLFDERNVNGECKYDNGFNGPSPPL
jgi:hypothetical protein